jgi:septal ring factor EnvC (AmiA/AmiB activator)
MIFKLLPIIKFITNSRTVANTVNSLIKQFNNHRNIKAETADLQKILDVQAEINEKLETQLNLLQDALSDLHKTIRRIAYAVIISMLLSLIAILAVIF